MNDQVSKCLFDIARACADITEFVRGVSFGQYSERKMVRSAVERQMIIIGEAMMQLRRLAPDILAPLHADVGSIIAFRDRLVHGYDTVDDSIVFRIATRDVPALLADVEALQEEEAAQDDGRAVSDTDD